MANHGISGTWRGHYSYAKMPDEGSGFDAVLEEEGGFLSGHIHDDFFLGEAVVSGSFSFPTLQFTKTYVQSSPYPVQYNGTMTEDGKTIGGKWSIVDEERGENHGSWTAYRTDQEEKKEDKLKQIKVRELEAEEIS